MVARHHNEKPHADAHQARLVPGVALERLRSTSGALAVAPSHNNASPVRARGLALQQMNHSTVRTVPATVRRRVGRAVVSGGLDSNTRPSR